MRLVKRAAITVTPKQRMVQKLICERKLALLSVSIMDCSIKNGCEIAVCRNAASGELPSRMKRAVVRPLHLEAKGCFV